MVFKNKRSKNLHMYSQSDSQRSSRVFDKIEVIVSFQVYCKNWFNSVNLHSCTNGKFYFKRNET